MSPIEAIHYAVKLAQLTGDPLYTSAIARLAPLLTDDDPMLDHPQTQNILRFIEKAVESYLAVYGKPLA